MLKQAIFPIDKIKKDSRVILYGAGKNGRELIDLNIQMDWCNIFLSVDIHYKEIKKFPIKVYSPEILTEIKEYDFILISVIDKVIRKKIHKYLIDLGIKESKIVDEIDVFICRDDENNIIDESIVESDKPLTIGFLSSGVMGDNVVALRLYQELVKLAPYSEIDIFSVFPGFPEHIYYGQKNLHKIIRRIPEEKDKKKYDILIQLYYEPSLLYCNLYRVRKLSKELAERLCILYEYQKKDYFMCSPDPYMNRLQWDRAKFMGYTCYTLLGSSGAFDITDFKVDFPLNPDYEKQFLELGLGERYITFNFGTSEPLKDGKQQTKMWPKEYHEKLNFMIKTYFPDIKLIQLGAKNVIPVQGADIYILGENLEVVKYILKNSLCHIDCEGGLVHIASQLGTKCFVVFGPTPVDFFGYNTNENIVSDECKECCGLIKDWYTRCYKYGEAKCMKSIKPETVFNRLKLWMKKDVK